jgi:hypothetical protein
MLIYHIEAFDKFSYFRNNFLFSKTKFYLFEVLKNIFKALNMFLSPLGAKSCLVIFLEFLEPSRYFSDVKYDFSIFLELF